MDAQWHQFQELGLAKPMENNNNSSSGNINTSNLISSSRRERPQKGKASLNCPRCKSPHTKFCYYNNYSLTQPRYHCKTCRRYWTEGGSLRNVPIGGGSRKCGKKINSSSSSNLNTLMSYITPVSTTMASTPTVTVQNPNQDLNLAFTTTATHTNNITNPPNVLNLLESGSRTMINPFMPIVQNYQSAFGLHEFRSSRFALDGVSGSVNEGMLFPFEEKWQGGLTNNIASNGSDRGDNPFLQKGFWTSMMGGGGGSGEKFDHI